MQHRGEAASDTKARGRNEEGGEPDDSIPFRIGILLDILNLEGQARLEYERYLVTRACTDPVPDGRCVIARAKVQEPLD